MNQPNISQAKDIVRALKLEYVGDCLRASRKLNGKPYSSPNTDKTARCPNCFV